MEHNILQEKNPSYDLTNGHFLTDSGYNSTTTFTPNNTLNLSQYPRHSLDRIDEDFNEFDNVKDTITTPTAAGTTARINNVIVTPTTFNIRKMNSMHLSTPQLLLNNDNKINNYKRSPLKRAASSSSLSIKTNSFSELFNNENINLTPKKLKYSNNENNENKMNVKRNTITPRKILKNQQTLKDKLKFSPIKKIDKKILKEKSINENLLNTSTPIHSYNFYNNNDQKYKNQLLTKSNSPKKRQATLFRKFQSFSPVNPIIDLVKKRLNYKPQKTNDNDNDTDNIVNDNIIKTKEINRKDIQKKRETLKRQNAFNNKEDSDLINDNNDDKKIITQNNSRLKNTRNSLELIDEKLRSKSNLSLEDRYTSTELNLELSLTPEYIRDHQRPKHHNYYENSFNFDNLNQQFINNDDNNIDIKGLLTNPILQPPIIEIEERFISPPNTPKKQKISNNQSSEKEWNDILYTELPKTPPKLKLFTKKLSLIEQSLSSSSSSSQEQQQQSDVHRKTNKIPRRSYIGFKRLNILLHLEDEIPALENIFLYLNGSDIRNCTMVCHNWKRIIDMNPKANLKKINYLRSIIPFKENNKQNGDYLKNVNDVFKTTSVDAEGGTIGGVGNEALRENAIKKIPFSTHTENVNNRKRSFCEPHSPPVSPSKRMFYENQKVVRKLDQNATLTKCPRCLRSSEIHSTTHLSLTTTNTTPVTSTTIMKSLSSPRRRLFRSLKKVSSVPYCYSTSSLSSSTSFDNLRSSRSLSLSGYTDNSTINHLINSPVQTNCTIFPSQILNEQQSHQQAHRETQKPSESSFEKSISGNNNLYDLDDCIKMNEYAVCTRPSCNFKFCIKCQCEIHPGRDCLLIEMLSSNQNQQQYNINDEITPKKKTIIGSKQSKRNLRRL